MYLLSRADGPVLLQAAGTGNRGPVAAESGGVYNADIMAKSARVPAAVHTVVAEVHEFCVANANPAIVLKYAKFFREGYDAFGLDHKDPAWVENRKRWVGRLRAAGPRAWLDVGDILTRTGKYEEASFAIEFAMDLEEFHDAAAFRRIGKWFDGGIRNWGHTDALCLSVLSHFLTDGIVQLEALTPWRESEHKFQRRAVPVMMIPLLNTYAGYAPLFSVVEPLMADGAREVHQGTGWFLREAWRRQPAPTEELLARHKDTAPRLIYQYATEKMSPQQKERFRRAKPGR